MVAVFIDITDILY